MQLASGGAGPLAGLISLFSLWTRPCHLVIAVICEPILHSLLSPRGQPGEGRVTRHVLDDLVFVW